MERTCRVLVDEDLQRAEGSGRLVLGGSNRGTRVVDLFQRSPIRVMFPTTLDGEMDEVVFLNTSGGVAGGDRVESAVTVQSNASAIVTSQAAEKVYRALSEPARVMTKLKVCDTSKLAWLPRETIVFNWARLSRATEIEISSGAELLALESIVLGRSASGEEMDGGYVADSWRVKKDGVLIWADNFRATPETFPHLRRRALLSNNKAIGTLIYFGPLLEQRLEFLREIAGSLPCQCVSTLIAGGLIVVRFAATVALDLRLALRSLLDQFSRQLGSAPSFRVPKMWSC